MSATFGLDVALHALFARNVSAHPQAIALAGGSEAPLTYADASNAVNHVARQINAFDLPPQSSIAVLLPNAKEAVLSILAIMQCGHVAVPMPVAWRKSDLVRACREAETAALITTANFALENLPELAAAVAIEVFELSFPCAFGGPLPDGVMPLEFSAAHCEPAFGGLLSPGIATMQPSPGGASFVLHRDEELLAAGLGAMLSADVRSGDTIVSAVSPSHFAGIASVLVPWLLSGGTLVLLPDLPTPDALVPSGRTHLVASVGAARPLVRLLDAELASIIALHFSGTSMRTDFSQINSKRIVDVLAFGEVCAIALPRADASEPQALPLGSVHAGNTGAGSPVILETNISESGKILVRGALVPKDAILQQEWLDTGYIANAGRVSAFHAARPDDVLAIGALRFSLPELERRILAAALVSRVQVLTDNVLGNKLIIWTERPEETMRALLDAGLPRVIAKAVQKADTLHARSA